MSKHNHGHHKAKVHRCVRHFCKGQDFRPSAPGYVMVNEAAAYTNRLRVRSTQSAFHHMGASLDLAWNVFLYKHMFSL